MMNADFNFSVDDDGTMTLDLPEIFKGENLRYAIDGIHSEQNRIAIDAVLDDYQMPDEFYDGDEARDLELLGDMLNLLQAVEASVEDIADITYDDWTFVRAASGESEVLDNADVVYTIQLLDQPFLAVDKAD